MCNLVQEEAVSEAEKANEPVDHPLLDRVRECSNNPDVAADFFLHMLHPDPTRRMRLSGKPHAYISQATAEMQAHRAAHSPKSVLRSYAIDIVDEGKLCMM